jgi:hypothetical protein
LPVRITDFSYDEEVVNYSTGETYDRIKPWFIFFYYKKCPISTKFKPQYEYIAKELKDFANFGMVDVIENEMLKETYGIKSTPYFVMLKNNVSIM